MITREDIDQRVESLAALVAVAEGLNGDGDDLSELYSAVVDCAYFFFCALFDTGIDNAGPNYGDIEEDVRDKVRAAMDTFPPKIKNALAVRVFSEAAAEEYRRRGPYQIYKVDSAVFYPYVTKIRWIYGKDFEN